MWSKATRASETVGSEKPLIFSGFKHGLNTNTPASQIAMTECSELVNFRVHSNGTLETREPMTLFVSGKITGSVKQFERLPIAGTDYYFLVGSDYKLYYKVGAAYTLIGTLEGDATLIAYNGVVVVMDGSFIKYLDGVASIKMAYDNGTGTDGHQFDNSGSEYESEIPVGNGTNTRVAYKFTSQAWTAGYTIPPTTVTAVLRRYGNGFTGTDNVNINVVLRKVSDDSVLATKTLVEAPLLTNLAATATSYSATFTAPTEMSPSIAYYASIEYANGDASHYVNVCCSFYVTGSGVYAAYKYTGTWAADATQNPLISLRPGMPPKGSFGALANRRLFVGGDPDNPGYVWYANLTHLDWSTSDGGGYVGAVDDSNNTYEVGAIQSLYKDLYVYGTQEQPYLCQLTGDSPTDYELPALFQKIWSLSETAIAIGNDIVSASSGGVKTLSGVQEYGDLRTFSISDPVEDRIIDYWGGSEIAGFYPKAGQYWLCMPDYHRILIFHTSAPTQNPSGTGVRYPISEYEFCLDVLTSSSYKWTSAGSEVYYMEAAAGGDPSFDVSPDAVTLDGELIREETAIGSIHEHEWWYGDNDSLGYSTVYFKDSSGDPDTTGVVLRSVLIPTCISSVDEDIYLGGSNGYVYKYSRKGETNPPGAPPFTGKVYDSYRDVNEHKILPVLGTNYTELPFSEAEFSEIQAVVSAKGGASFTTYFYINSARRDYHATKPYRPSAYDDLLISEAHMTIEHAQGLVGGSAYDTMYKDINFNAHSVKIVVKDVTLGGYQMYLNGLMLKYRMLP